MNIEEIREAARERDYERETKPLAISGSPEPVVFDLRGLSEAMAPKLKALASQFAVATEKLADILDKAWGEISAASETSPATGLRGEGASLLLEGMIKVANHEELNWDDPDDDIAIAKEMIGHASRGLGRCSVTGVASEAVEMDLKLAEVAALTCSTVESIRDSVSALARSSPKSMAESLADVSLDLCRIYGKRDLVAKMYSGTALVAVSGKLEKTHTMYGGTGYSVKFHKPEPHQTNAILYKAGRSVQIRIEDGMGTPHTTWDVPDEQALRYARSDSKFQFDFDAGSGP
jgi:hypothetical protein